MAISVTADEDTRDEPERRPRAVAITPTAAAQAASPPRWSKSYGRALVLIDVCILGAALVVATLIGSQPFTLPLFHGTGSVSVWLVVALIALILLGGLSMSGSRSARVVGVGTQEYRSILYSCFFAFASVALLAYVTSLAG